MPNFSKNLIKNPLGGVSPLLLNPQRLKKPGEGLPRYHHFTADQSGCGFWRMIWPAEQLLIHNKAVVSTFYHIIVDPVFYKGVDAVRLQRQCTENQYKFVKHLRKISDEFKRTTGKGFKLIWEVDDVVCPIGSIPDYNKAKEGFTDYQILDSVKRIVNLCDEMTTVSPRMREHYKQWLSYDKISVIPNYFNRNWFSRFYSKSDVINRFKTNKKNKKIRIGYAGSPTHFDVANRANQQDDFSHVVDEVIKRIDDFKFVFFGGYPKKIEPYVKSGKVEYQPWGNLDKFPQMLSDLKLNLMIAPLMDNDFSSSKSNIKFLEAAALGIPCICQDLPCYEISPWKFKTGKEMFNHIDSITSNFKKYESSSDEAWSIMQDFWLDDKLDEIKLVYDTPYADPSRLQFPNFVKNNKEQFDPPEIPVYTL